jgi:dTDP-4-dehydrorhamnose reductase
MRAIVTGAGGQLGRALVASRPEGIELVAADRTRLDLGEPAAIAGFLAAHRPALVVNAAAFTDVDGAEREPERARTVNAIAVGALAQACARHGARLIQLSTDFVFDGEATRPYAPHDPTGPLNVYGATKREGEELALRHAPGALVLRTAWLHAAGGGRNFVAAMLRAMRAGRRLSVVRDQIGTPTHAAGLAAALWRLATLRAEGIVHVTDGGAASRYEFACAIRDDALALGLIDAPVPIEPVATADYPTCARRPAFGVLDCTAAFAMLGMAPPPWRAGLRATLATGADG